MIFKEFRNWKTRSELINAWFDLRRVSQTFKEEIENVFKEEHLQHIVLRGADGKYSSRWIANTARLPLDVRSLI